MKPRATKIWKKDLGCVFDKVPHGGGQAAEKGAGILNL